MKARRNHSGIVVDVRRTELETLLQMPTEGRALGRPTLGYRMADGTPVWLRIVDSHTPRPSRKIGHGELPTITGTPDEGGEGGG